MTGPQAAWRLVFQSYLCPTCGARPGEECRTSTGRLSRLPHVARGQYADRCPKCGDRLPDGWDPGALCARCHLVRQLEIERMTTWRRTDP